MRLIPLFLALAATAPLSLVQAQEAPAPHDESVPHVHEEAKDPKDETLVDYLFRKSDVAFHDGDYPRAISLHRSIIAIAPTEIESYSLGAWLLWSLDKPGEAIEILAKGLKANPNSVEMWDVAAQHYDLQKRFADSDNAYGKAVELSGKDVDQMLLRRQAHAAEKVGNWNKSADIWRALVAQYPNDTVNQNNLGRVEKTIAEQQAKEKQARVQQTASLLGGAGLMVGVASVLVRNREV